jgi:hypothetical protein
VCALLAMVRIKSLSTSNRHQVILWSPIFPRKSDQIAHYPGLDPSDLLSVNSVVTFEELLEMQSSVVTKGETSRRAKAKAKR